MPNEPGKWAIPQTVSMIDFMLGANTDELLPAKDDIPEEFWRGRTAWNKFINKWFFQGLQKEEIPEPKDGINKVDALRHVGACLGSFQPKHEHKEAGCAYLMSLWFKLPATAESERGSEVHAQQANPA